VILAFFSRLIHQNKILDAAEKGFNTKKIAGEKGILLN